MIAVKESSHVNGGFGETPARNIPLFPILCTCFTRKNLQWTEFKDYFQQKYWTQVRYTFTNTYVYKQIIYHIKQCKVTFLLLSILITDYWLVRHKERNYTRDSVLRSTFVLLLLDLYLSKFLNNHLQLVITILDTVCLKW